MALLRESKFKVRNNLVYLINKDIITSNRYLNSLSFSLIFSISLLLGLLLL